MRTWSDLMVPGYNSDDPSTWASRKGLPAKQPERKLKMAKTAEDEPEAVPEVTVNAELDQYRLSYNAAIDEIQKKAPAEQPQFSLSGPMTITAKKRDGGYTKKAHIGGEDFRPMDCYLGKRGKIIYRFAPCAVADYAWIEMEENPACKELLGFEKFLIDTIGSEMRRVKREGMEAASVAAEREKLADRQEVYADLGFGSW